MVLILISGARAATYGVPGEYATVADVLAAADLDEPIEILIDPGTTDAGDAVDVSNLDITIRSGSPGTQAIAPPIGAVDGGCTLTLTDLRIEASHPFTDSATTYDASVFVDECRSLTIDTLTVDAVADHALAIMDTEAEIGALSLEGRLASSAIWIYATTGLHPTRITDTTFTGLTEGAIYAYNTTRTRGLPIELERVAFIENDGGTYADIWANMAALDLRYTSFKHHTTSWNSPLYIQNSDFTCTWCDVDNRRGTRWLFIPLGNDEDVVRIEESRLRLGTGEEVLDLTTGTTVQIVDTLVEMMDGNATLISTSSGSVDLDGVDVRGTSVIGGSTYVIAAASSAVSLVNTRFCRLTATKPIYLAGGSLSADRLILQAVTSQSGNPALWSYDDGSTFTASIENATFAGSASGPAFGGNASGGFDLRSSIVTDNAVGIEVGFGGVWTEDSYNLWYGNTSDSVLEIVPPAPEYSLWTSPSLSGFNPDDCDTWPVPDVGSPVTDAGAPDVTDPDGSRADIGAIPAGGTPDIGWHGPYATGPDGGGEDTGDTGDTGDDTGSPDDTDTPVDTDEPTDTDDPGDTGAPTDDDPDGDGFGSGDCAPGNASVHPGAEEVAEDGIDQDCDGADMKIRFGGGACGCATASTTLGWLPILLLALGARRRG